MTEQGKILTHRRDELRVSNEAYLGGTNLYFVSALKGDPITILRVDVKKERVLPSGIAGWQLLQ